MGDEWKLYFDGACEPFNPGGVATYGFQVSHDSTVEKCQFLLHGNGVTAVGGPEATNNVAEYTALLKGLMAINPLVLPGDKLEILGDSQLVIRQLEGQYAVNAPHLKAIYSRCALAIHNIRVSGRPVQLTWIPREKNGSADFESKKAIKEAFLADPEILKKLILPFGMHKGKSLYDVPPSYYHWLWTNKGGEVPIPQRPAAASTPAAPTLTALKKCPCGHSDCGVSTSIDDVTMTFGRGGLDEWGFWMIPCGICARAWEASHPGVTAWPGKPEEKKTEKA